MSCSDCTQGIVLPGEPIGQLNSEFNVQSYFSPGGSSPSSTAVILLTDAFGLPLKNCKILADQLSQRLSCDVWVPDLFNGSPLLKIGQLNLPDRAGVRRSFLEKVKFAINVIPSIPRFISNKPAVVDDRIATFIGQIKQEKGYQKLGAVGYCFGGAAAVRLGCTDLVECVVICHPGKFPVSIIDDLKVPSSWACAEDDASFIPSSRKAAEEKLAKINNLKKTGSVEYEFKDYKGTAHGFAARPNLLLPEVKVAYEGALEQTISWFNKFIM